MILTKYSHMDIEERSDAVQALLMSDFTIEQIAFYLQTTPSIISSFIQKNKIHNGSGLAPKSDVYSYKDESFKESIGKITSRVIHLYNNGWSVQEILDEYRYTHTFRYHSRQELKSIIIKIVNNNDEYYTRQKYINKYAFTNIDDEETAYWIGFLTADGYVSDNNVLSCNLQARDYYHLMKLSLYLHVDGTPLDVVEGRIKLYKHEHESAYFSLSSKLLCEKLALFNIIPRKSKITDCPDCLLHNRHYWQGVIDGDGSVGISKYGSVLVSISGSKRICEQFQEFCNGIDGFSSDSKISKTNTTHLLGFSSLKAKKVIKYLYNDTEIYLERKFETAQYILSGEYKNENYSLCYKPAKGYRISRTYGKLTVDMTVSGKNTLLGHYDTEDAAEEISDIAAVHLYKREPQLNHPENKKIYEQVTLKQFLDIITTKSENVRRRITENWH